MEEIRTPPCLLDSTNASECLGVNPATLYSWRRRGLGPPAIRIGKYLRWDAADLRAWVDEKRCAS
jgi:predicted DNA-binding transcriptional regulator AlpA